MSLVASPSVLPKLQVIWQNYCHSFHPSRTPFHALVDSSRFFQARIVGSSEPLYRRPVAVIQTSMQSQPFPICWSLSRQFRIRLFLLVATNTSRLLLTSFGCASCFEHLLLGCVFHQHCQPPPFQAVVHFAWPLSICSCNSVAPMRTRSYSFSSRISRC